MGQNIHRFARLAVCDFTDKVKAVATDRLIDRHILIGNRSRVLVGSGPTQVRWQRAQLPYQAVKRPAQIDRSRAGGCQHGRCCIKMIIRRVRAHGECHAIGSTRADERRTAHHHVAYGGGHLGRVADDPTGEAMGQ